MDQNDASARLIARRNTSLRRRASRVGGPASWRRPSAAATAMLGGAASTAATTGGKKTTIRVGLSATHWEWIASVSAKCAHASTSKTLRILLDWYKLYATANNRHLSDDIWGCSDWDSYFRDGEGNAEGDEEEDSDDSEGEGRDGHGS